MSTFAIKLGNYWLDMPDKYSINGVFNNSLFEFDQMEGEFTYGFQLPATPNNTAAFEFSDAVESTSTTKSYQVTTYLSGTFWKNALLITSYKDSREGFSVNLNFSVSYFAATTGKKLMKDIDYGVDGYVPESYRYMLCYIAAAPGLDTGDYINVDINSGLKNYTVYITTSFNAMLTDLCAQINADYATHGMLAEWKKMPPDSATQSQLAFLYIHDPIYVNNKSITLTVTYGNLGTVHMSDFYPQLDNDLFPDQYYSHIRDHMNNVLNYQYYGDFFENIQYCFPTVFNENLFNNHPEGGSEALINEYDADDGEYAFTGLLNSIPFPYVHHLFKKMVADSNYALTGSFFNDAEIRTLILSSMFCQDKPDPSDTYMGDELDLRNHVADLTPGTFIQALKSLFCIGIFFKDAENQCYVVPFKELYASPDYDDWTDKASDLKKIQELDKGFEFAHTFSVSDALNGAYNKEYSLYRFKGTVNTIADLPTVGNVRKDVMLVLQNNTFYTVDVNDVTLWVEYSEFLNNLQYSDKSINIKPQLGPMGITASQYIASDPPRTWNALFPNCSAIGTSIYWDLFTPYTPQLLFFRGLRKDADDDDYPMASYDVYDYAFNKIANYSLKWDGADGLVAKWWTEYINFWQNTRLVTRRIALGEKELRDPKPWLKKRIDRVNAFYKQIRFTLTELGFQNVEVDYYPCNRTDGIVPYNTYTPAVEPVCDSIRILTLILPPLDQEIVYSIPIQVETCCSGELTFTVTDGALPESMDIDEHTGVISGHNDNPGAAYNFTIMVEDLCGNADEATYTYTP